MINPGTERFKVKKDALDRQHELKEQGWNVHIYHGHRHYVVQYWK